MSSRDDKNQKDKRRHRSKSPDRGFDKWNERKRSRSNDRGNSKRGDRRRSRSRDRGLEKRSDRQDKKAHRRSRSRSRSRDRTSKGHGEREKEKDRDGTHREKDREGTNSTVASTERDLEKKIGSQAKTKLIISTIPKTEAEIEKDRETQKEEEQAILDDEMRKRRERVKAWQDEKSKRIAAEAAVINSSLLSALSSSHVRGGVESITNEEQTGATSSVPSEGGNDNSITLAPAAWNLEDDDDDDEKMGMQTGNIDVLEMDTDMPPLVTSRNSDASQGMLGQNLGSKTGVTVFDQMNPLKVRKMSIGGSSSPQGSSGSSSVKLETKFDASSSGDNSDISILTSMELKSDESRTIKSTSGAIKVIASSSSSLVAALPAGEREREGIAPDFDPLDDFMSSLYGEGEVVEQRGLPSDNSLQKLEFERFKSNGLLLSGGSIYGVQGNSVDGSRAFMGRRGEGQYDSQNISMSVTEGKENAQRPSDSLSVTDEDDDGYSFLAGSSHGGENSRLNQFGSNFITLDQIMGSKSPSALGSSSSGSGSRQGYSSRVDYNNSGWESDSAPPSPAPKYSYSRGEISGDIDGETEGEREEREDKDRKEFIDAIRAARAAEEVVRERLKQKEEAAEKSKEQLGRVFAGEGDVMDENDIEEKKKSALEILEEAKKGKELKPIDHKAIEYIPFRKNLYIVPRALSKLTEEDLTEKREDLQIKVRGKGCPAPVDTWGQCGLSERVLGVIEKLGLDAPFAIQKQAIPAIMCGRDLIGVAKTGSGKTLAFLLPMFRHIMDQPPLREQEGPIGLIMAPARELAFQIFNEAKKFSKALGIRVACIYGGAGVADQIADLKRGAEIVVCTPGRMIDILCMQAGKLVNLRRVTMVVLDEADRCFDMGFAPQIEMVLQNIRPDRQTVLFSATFPKQIEKLAKTVLRLPLEVVVGERSSVNKDITQVVEVHEDSDKFMRLLQLLGVWYDKGSVLVFVDTQEKCDQLFHDLLKSGYPCLSLHGGKDQLDRDHTLHEFKKGIKTVMVATSVAGRGLDVPDIVVVINYNCPNHIEDYVHRVGRTGRAGRKGTAYTFISHMEEQHSSIMIKALEKAGQTPADELLEMAAGFKEKVARGEARYSSNGFDGKGFTFDASELSETQKNNSLQRRAYDVEQGIDEKDDEEEDGDEEKQSGPSSSSLTGTGTGAGAVATPVVQSTPLERARAIATSLCLSKGLPVPTVVTPPSTSTAVSLGADGKVDSRAAMVRAKLIAAQLASGGKLGEGAGEVKEPAAHFSEELDINDYPPQARRKVTHKNALDDVSEQTGVAIISRGSYVPPGKKLEVGERRLFLLIEGNTDLQVRQAKLEILRMLDEETMRLGASGNSSSFGRYAVL